jgi:hypothetical protein
VGFVQHAAGLLVPPVVFDLTLPFRQFAQSPIRHRRGEKGRLPPSGESVAAKQRDVNRKTGRRHPRAVSVIEIGEPQDGQIICRLQQCRLDHRCKFRMYLVSSELSGLFQEDLLPAVQLIACPEELTAAIQRRHRLSVKHRNELDAGMPGFVRFKAQIEPQTRAAQGHRGTCLFDADDQSPMNLRDATIPLMRVTVGSAIVIDQLCASWGQSTPSSR